METRTCVLCGAPADWEETPGEGGSLHYYHCSNPACGDYEISTAAQSALERETFRTNVRESARYAREHGGYLSVTQSDTGEIAATILPKRR